jgi:hypothetical protein
MQKKYIGSNFNLLKQPKAFNNLVLDILRVKNRSINIGKIT